MRQQHYENIRLRQQQPAELHHPDRRTAFVWLGATQRLHRLIDSYIETVFVISQDELDMAFDCLFVYCILSDVCEQSKPHLGPLTLCVVVSDLGLYSLGR